MIEIGPGVHTLSYTKGRMLNKSRMSAKGYTQGAAERHPEEIMRRTEATSSGWPAAQTTKQIANTDQLREALRLKRSVA
jgi:hypothetical protein